jgi:hypothetical protein
MAPLKPRHHSVSSFCEPSYRRRLLLTFVSDKARDGVWREGVAAQSVTPRVTLRQGGKVPRSTSASLAGNLLASDGLGLACGRARCKTVRKQPTDTGSTCLLPLPKRLVSCIQGTNPIHKCRRGAHDSPLRVRALFFVLCPRTGRFCSATHVGTKQHEHHSLAAAPR